MMKKIKKLVMAEAEGIGVIEIVLILLVLIGLVIIFREQINNIISSVFDSINDAVDTF